MCGTKGHVMRPGLRVNGRQIIHACVNCGQTEGGIPLDQHVTELRGRNLTVEARCGYCGYIHSETVSCRDHCAKVVLAHEEAEQKRRLQQPSRVMA